MESPVPVASPPPFAEAMSGFSPDFAARPAALRAEGTKLESLVHHHEHVEASLPLELAYAAFRERKLDYMAVQRAGIVVGLCSRGQIGFVMGSRYGFALYSQSPVETAMVPGPLIVTHETPVRTVLDRALARRGDSFHEDVVLVDTQHRLIGLIQAEKLAQLQSRLVAEQLEALHAQHETLRQQNLELFRASHAVRQSQGLYLGLFESHALGVALLDPDGSIHEHNRRLGELLGFNDSPASLISLAAWIDEKERAGFLALLQEHARGGAAVATREFTVNIAGRGARTFRCSLGWIKETGQICACIDDVTDQRLLERSMLRQEKQRLLDTLVGGIAHELNNKLTPVAGFAEMLSAEVTGEHARRYANYIDKSVEEAARIIRQLLQLSKPHATTAQVIDLRAVIDETLVMLRFQARQARCEVRIALPAEPVWVMAEPGQMKQVVLNLTLNAIQATEGGPQPQLAVEVRCSDQQAELVVTDNGCGIATENIGRIFDPFFTTKGPERGTGLGLSICYSIVRQHGGDISVESRMGEGTTFTVALPRERNAPSVIVMPVVEDAPGQPGIAMAHGARVLVVDDEDVVRKLLQELLRTRFNCHVDLAGNGAEALALADDRYALVLSDIQMPVMNGLEFYRQLGATHPVLARRLVFLTGHPGGRALEAEIAACNVPVIAKPFSVSRLTEVCAPFLRASDGGAV